MKSAGYTMVEVLMAIGVLTAGSVGIMAMHQAATRGNMEARQVGTANQVAQRWVERLHRDGLVWTQSSQNANPTDLAATTYLRNVTAVGTPPLWFVPTPTAASGESARFDYYGTDSATGVYCTNVRLEWLYPGSAMRADVRVWWMRRGSSTSMPAGSEALVNCAPTTNPNALTGDRRVRMVYTTTVVRFNPLPQ